MRRNGRPRVESVMLMLDQTGHIGLLWHPPLPTERVRQWMAPQSVSLLEKNPKWISGVRGDAGAFEAIFREIARLCPRAEEMEAELWAAVEHLVAAQTTGVSLMTWGRFFDEAAQGAGAVTGGG